MWIVKKDCRNLSRAVLMIILSPSYPQLINASIKLLFHEVFEGSFFEGQKQLKKPYIGIWKARIYVCRYVKWIATNDTISSLHPSRDGAHHLPAFPPVWKFTITITPLHLVLAAKKSKCSALICRYWKQILTASTQEWSNFFLWESAILISIGDCGGDTIKWLRKPRGECSPTIFAISAALQIIRNYNI